MRGMSTRWMPAALGVAAAALACNAIVGVGDVTAKQNVSPNDDAGPITPGDDDDDAHTTTTNDGGTPGTVRPTLGLGFTHSCARMLDGTVRCWGSDYEGELGDGADAATEQDSLNPRSVAGITDAIAIASGSSHTCVVHKTGKVSCWGANFAGALGNGNNNDSWVPVDVTGITDAIDVGAGGGTTCIIHKDRTVSCWGANENGGLGDGTTVDKNTPITVPGLSNIAEIRPSTNTTCALTVDGNVYCWGAGSQGQLGNGSTTDTSTPTQLTALSKIAHIAVAYQFACAMTSAGVVSCWGANDSGQLGNGNPTTQPNPSPILVPNLTDAVQIWAGNSHACAVRSKGQVACWGDGTYGQLGVGPIDASAPTRPTPVAVSGLTNAAIVYTGGFRTCVITTTSSALCFGDNSDGQLGNGSTDSAFTPVQVNDFP